MRMFLDVLDLDEPKDEECALFVENMISRQSLCYAILVNFFVSYCYSLALKELQRRVVVVLVVFVFQASKKNKLLYSLDSHRATISFELNFLFVFIKKKKNYCSFFFFLFVCIMCLIGSLSYYIVSVFRSLHGFPSISIPSWSLFLTPEKAAIHSRELFITLFKVAIPILFALHFGTINLVLNLFFFFSFFFSIP